MEHHALSNAAMQLVQPVCYNEIQTASLHSPFCSRGTPFSIGENAHQQFACNTVNTVLVVKNYLHFYSESRALILKQQITFKTRTLPNYN
jgi:hypothetical protein